MRLWLVMLAQLVDTNRPFQFQKRGQLVIRTHNEAPSVVAVRVNNPDRSPLQINGRNAAPTPSGFAEIVRNGLPILHKGAGFLPPCAAQVLERDYVADTRAPGA